MVVEGEGGRIIVFLFSSKIYLITPCKSRACPSTFQKFCTPTMLSSAIYTAYIVTYIPSEKCYIFIRQIGKLIQISGYTW